MNTLLTNASTAVEIAEAIERQIRQGDLLQNASLPSVRDLAVQLKVSPNTVAAAYRRLRDSGIVVTHGRRGTRVSAPASEIVEYGFVLPEGLYDMASGNLDASLLPAPDPEWLLRNVTQSGFDPFGDDPQLSSLARDWLDSQQLPSEQVGVYCGALDAVERALRARCRPGATVLIEDPCWPPLRDLLTGLQLKPGGLSMDEHGAVAPAPEVLRGAAAVVLTPRAQNPTGCSFDTPRWQQWSAALQDAPHTLLVIDDHWGPLSQAPAIDLQPPPQHWLYVLSTSKFIGPDLRVSIAGASASLHGEMQRQQRVGPRWVSLLLQRLTAHLWSRMLQAGRLTEVGAAYRSRRQSLVEALELMGVSLSSSSEGLHLWLPVIDETSTVQALASAGWAVQAGSPFRLQSGPAVRVSVGNLAEADTARLAADIASAMQARRRRVY
ncbi:aminotransferase class I/II-fold pyridoxal phosphate-dependent enzyme [Pseudomonas sp. RIT-PI-a]|uniref:aminotransferase class I/II-fold pyridoxal phosphate-dependent enzyme n=1 Tax=Pseudomonas sp. RIT-PI-a TaxID=1681194 RepID=UPI000676872F|nr:aminotransferase class I/II-fold pyridoxal phosphate-dependent enzyme [Pseudomonas sp. RIT-PI-a]KNC06808.1 GntR family transcriptional regulator [Pseudomonas sp. RIT-PI-a]